VVARKAEVRFYFDADILGVAHVICGLRNDATYPGDSGALIHKRKRERCPIAPGTPDDVWVPQVTKLNWLIISRDHNIRENPLERRVVRESGARMIALSGEHAGSKWVQLELIMKHWRRIELLAIQPGPFIYLATYSRMKALDLSDTPGPRRSPQPRTRRAAVDRSAEQGLWEA
jgi:hypothetical protein